MRGSKTSRIMYVLGLLLLLYTFSSLDANAYQYTLGVSRKYYSGSNAYIVGTGGIVGYEKEYFTGLGYCTGYYYVNHYTDAVGKNISLARQVIKFDSSNVRLSGDYINPRLTGGSTAWSTYGYGPLTDSGFSLFRFPINRIDTFAPYIPPTYTLGRFRLNTYQIISGTNISLYYVNPTTYDNSTHIEHTDSTFATSADLAYHVDIIYYAQPCIPDMPIPASYTTKINGNATGLYAMARVPAFNFETDGYFNTNSGRPITLGYTNFASSNFVPGNFNIASFNKHISFDSGIYLAGIKEPDVSSQPNEAFNQGYYYNAGAARSSGFSLVDTNYIAAISGTSNQRGINPNTIKVTLSFTGVDRTNYADIGTPCTITITGDTNLGLSGLGYSRNRNQLGYSVNISAENIRILAKQQCSFTTIATGNIDLKRETVANIKWDAWDYANSMIISQDNNVETYAPANQITQATGYSFNAYTSNPLLSMATDTTSLTNGSTVYNIPITNQNLKFTGTDDYAGINSGTFVIVVSGYESSVNGLSNTWRTSGTPNRSYVFSNSDVTTFPFNLHNERYDYTGWVDFANKIGATTGTHFTISLKATDFVGNTNTQNYIFRTPTWPNRPKGNPPLISAQTNIFIPQTHLIEHITQDTVADGGGAYYNYLTYYPSSSGLIANFSYISGGTYINSTTEIVLTAPNGNVSGAPIVTLNGLQFMWDGTGTVISGTPQISSGGAPMLDYVATSFTFNVLATNIYGITGVMTYTINVAPSCTESAGCTNPVFVFRGTTLAAAMAQQSAAVASGYDYLMATHRYPHWFAEIKQTGPDFYFTGTDQVQTLYCAGTTGNDLLINYGGYTGPQDPLVNSPSSTNFTGTNLHISSDTIHQFGVFTASVSADYAVVDNLMTIYVNRPLTGRVFYPVCELVGGSLDAFGCPMITNHNWTGDVNWSRFPTNDAQPYCARATQGGSDYGLDSSQIFGVATDSGGNTYVAGRLKGTATFGSTTLTSNGSSDDALVAKLSPTGDYLRAVNGGGTSTERVNGITIDNEGNSYIVGYFYGTATFGSTTLVGNNFISYSFIAKLSPTGDYLRAVKGGGTNDVETYSVAVDSQGNSYIAGYFLGTATFSGLSSLVSSGNTDMFIAKLSPTGNYLRATKGGGTSPDEAKGIAIDTQGNTYIAGLFQGTATFGSITLTSIGGVDVFVAKVSQTGNYLRATKGLGSTLGDINSVAVDSQGNSYIVGYFEGMATFGSIPLTSSGSINGFLAKVSATGNYLRAMKGWGDSDVRSEGIAVDSKGNAYMGGYFLGTTANFGSTTLTKIGAGTPAFITKISPIDTLTLTGWVEGGWLTGNWDGYVTGGSINNGNQFDFWSGALVYDGGGYRKYARILSGTNQENINSSGIVNFNLLNRTGSTATFDYEIYWIDNTPPQVTGTIINTTPNESVTLQLDGTNTGQLANSQISNLIGDDEYSISQFVGSTGVQLFEGGYGSAVHTGGRYLNGAENTYKMTHTLTFAANRTGYIYVVDRAGNQSSVSVDVAGISNITGFIITVRPAFRPDPATDPIGYEIDDGDFWLFVLSGSQWIEKYNSAKNVGIDPKITTTKYGTAVVYFTPPANGSEYLVAVKRSGTVAAGFTGIWSSAVTAFNFFTGTFADHLSSDFVYKFSSGGNMEYYLKVGDIISNTTGDYDYVGTTDFSQINNYLTLGTNSLPFYRYSFDTNNVISSMEQSMVLQARDSHGFIGWLDNNNILPMSAFVTF